VIHDEIAALEVANREERFTRSRIRHGFQILNRTAQQRIGRTGNQTIAPDVIPVAVFQLLQRGGSVGVHHPYGIFAVFGFQLIQQVDQPSEETAAASIFSSVPNGRVLSLVAARG
jgi:hypothetical protein